MGQLPRRTAGEGPPGGQGEVGSGERVGGSQSSPQEVLGSLLKMGPPSFQPPVGWLWPGLQWVRPGGAGRWGLP